MKPGPLSHALLAEGYIAVIATFMYYVPKTFLEDVNVALVPMFMLSLLVFSVSLMGYLFFYIPVTLLLEGKRKEAVHEFMRTILYFGVLTATVFAILVALSQIK